MLYDIKQCKLNTKRSFRESNNDYKMKQCSIAEKICTLCKIYEI